MVYASCFSDLRLRELPNMDGPRQRWELTEDFSFELKLNGMVPVWKVTVPQGFQTDLASIPRLFWMIFPPLGPWNKAAVLHDFLYSVPGCSSFLADALFREAMAQLRVPLWRRVLMYYAVRCYSSLGFRGKGFSKRK